MKVFLLSLLLATSLFAGQSFVFNFTSQIIQNLSVPSQTGAWYEEFYIDSIPSSLGSNPWFLVFNDNATGITNIELQNCAGGSLCLTSLADGVILANTTVGANFPTQAFYVRVQHDKASLGAGHSDTDYFEVWDTNGILQYQNSAAYITPTSTSTGAAIIGTADAQHIAFIRLCSGAILPYGASKMPTTAGGCTSGTRIYEWKFDGDLTDSSGNGYNATLTGGSATYATTNYQNVLSVIKTMGAPFWSNWVSMRAGYPNQLDGTSSLSQADASAAVTCAWTHLSGPSVPTYDNTGSCTPTITNLVFGDYNEQLVATSITAATATSNLDIGAVVTNNNGVVTNSATADQMFGPMIAFGKNPWALQDKLAIQATTLRSASYNTFPGIPPTWDTALTGTVSYPFIAQTGTTFASQCLLTDTSCTVIDSTQLDLSSLPAVPVIVFTGNGAAGEYMRVCSVSGAGNNTLNFCYDGRGYRYGTANHLTPTTWPATTVVTQHKVTGSGTSLMATFNPLGPGWSGIAISTAGTCQVKHNDPGVIGSGTNWTSPANAGFAIRISGHHSGVVFEFFAYVSSVTDATHLTLNRIFPNDATDESGLTCSTFQPDLRNAVLHYKRCGPSAGVGCVDAAYPYDGYTYFFTDGCESNTECYVYGGFDPLAVHPGYSTCLGSPPYQNTLMECAVRISYMDGFGYVGDNYGVNFYDEGLAHMALYLRSGWTPALTAFRKVEGQEGQPNNGYMYYPEMAQGDIGGYARRASVLGMWAAYLLDGKTSNLQGLRSWANNAVRSMNNFSMNGGCNVDLRESIGYPLQWLAAAALWDPSAISLGYQSALATWYTTYSGCANSGSALLTNSWANGFLWANNQTVPFLATTGSAVLTGTGINSNICGTTPSATGTATVVNGSDVVTGSGFVTGGGKIMFEDSVLGLLTFNYIFDSSSQVHLSGQYPGSNAMGVVWWINTDSSFNGTGYDSSLAFASSNTDPQLTKQWNCTWNNSGQITLDRNWDDGFSPGHTVTVYGWRGNLGGIGITGKGVQPFFNGVNVSADRIASKQSGSTGTNFNTLGSNNSTWLKTYGFDPTSGGTYYGRIYPACEPIYVDSSQPQNFPEGFRNPQCSYNGWTIAKQISRVNSVELLNAGTVSFANDSSVSNQTFWDTFYANIWDVAPYTQATFGSDGLGSANCGPTNNFALGKWTGFCFGMGMSHQWPAARLGGVTGQSTSSQKRGTFRIQGKTSVR